jgi:hypothetical protein
MQHKEFSKDQEMPQFNLNEGLEAGDLKRLIHPRLHIDEYKSKMGKDEDIVVLSFKVVGREPSEDLVNFLEKGYEWVIDADVSSGEMDDGDFIVFVECDRLPEVSSNVLSMMEDLMNLTEQELTDWKICFRSNPTEFDVTEESIANNVPLTTDDYRRRYGSKELDEMRTAAGVPVHTKAPKNDYTENLRSLAGII